VKVPPAACAALHHGRMGLGGGRPGGPDQPATPIQQQPRLKCLLQSGRDDGPGLWAHGKPPHRLLAGPARPSGRASRTALPQRGGRLALQHRHCCRSLPTGRAGRCSGGAGTRPRPPAAAARWGHAAPAPARHPAAPRPAVTPKGLPSPAESAATPCPSVSTETASVSAPPARGSTFRVISVRIAQRAMAARQQLSQIQPGDILVHPPTGADDFRMPGHGTHAQHLVPRRATGKDAPWPGQVGGDDAAQRRRQPWCRTGRRNPAARRSASGRARPAPPRSPGSACRRARPAPFPTACRA
jgi:hypothetical protein